jgi:hypothetical protein
VVCQPAIRFFRGHVGPLFKEIGRPVAAMISACAARPIFFLISFFWVISRSWFGLGRIGTGKISGPKKKI